MTRYRIMRMHRPTATQHPTTLMFATRCDMYRTLHDWNAGCADWCYRWEP